MVDHMPPAQDHCGGLGVHSAHPHSRGASVLPSPFPDRLWSERAGLGSNAHFSRDRFRSACSFQPGAVWAPAVSIGNAGMGGPCWAESHHRVRCAGLGGRVGHDKFTGLGNDTGLGTTEYRAGLGKNTGLGTKPDWADLGATYRSAFHAGRGSSPG